MAQAARSLARLLVICGVVLAGSAQPALAQLPAGWISASVAANGCAAVSTGASDNRPALQCMIDYLYGVNLAGHILLPSGWLNVCSTLVLKGAITLQGVGKEGTVLASCGNHTTILIDSSVRYGGFRDLFVVGYQNAAATQPAVRIQANVPAILRDCNIWGGSWGLMTSGADGVVDNCFIMGDNPIGGGIWSDGANWYRRVKVDVDTPRGYGFAQVGSFNGQIMENTFDQSDFSGPFTHSIFIAHQTAWTVCNSCVVSGPVTIEQSTTTTFAAGSRFGAIIVNNGGPLLLSAVIGVAPIIVTGSGPHSCGVTHNIAC